MKDGRELAAGTDDIPAPMMRVSLDRTEFERMISVDTAELLFFIRFGLKIWKSRVLPGGNAAGELKTGLNAALAALENDLGRLAGDN